MQDRLITGEKTPEQIQAMRDGGKKLAQIFQDIRDYIHAGMSEKDIDAFVDGKIKEYGASATYKTDEVNFPGVICISTNDEIVHSPASDYIFQKGDVVSFDLVITYKDMKTDSAFTMVVDDKLKGDVRTGDIAAAIEKVLKDGKLGIIRELVGHGVGLKMHMPPDVPNYGRKHTGVLLHPGDTIAIEPMATLGGEKIVTDKDDGWTIRTRDGSLAAHFEHTVLITENGAEIITQL